jgi:hypothetical protein
MFRAHFEDKRLEHWYLLQTVHVDPQAMSRLVACSDADELPANADKSDSISSVLGIRGWPLMALADTIIATVIGKHHRRPTYSYFVGSTTVLLRAVRSGVPLSSARTASSPRKGPGDGFLLRTPPRRSKLGGARQPRLFEPPMHHPVPSSTGTWYHLIMNCQQRHAVNCSAIARSISVDDFPGQSS